MYDVVPPALPPQRKSRRPVRRHPPAPLSPPAPATPRVVTLQWRLPARLRRPIKQELARQRRQQKQKQAIVAFERRPLYSQVPTTRPTYGRPQVTASTDINQQNTGDVYQHSRPNVVVGLPPYRASKQVQASTQLRRQSPAPSVKKHSPVPPVRPRRAAAVAALANDVRDVPYRWASPTQSSSPSPGLFVNEAQQLLAPVQPPKRRLAFPLHFSIFPWKKKRSEAVRSGGSKKKL